jgi:hypothetical protein
VKRHPVDLVPLVLGLALVAVAVAVLLDHLGAADLEAGFVLPLLLLVVGAAGLLGSLSRLGREAGTPYDDDGRPDAQPPPR